MTTPSEVRCVRYSGIRLKSPFAQSSFEIENLAGKIVQQIPGFAVELQKNPVVVDDNYRNITELLFWCRAMQQGEVILCHSRSTNDLIGVVFLSDIKFGASLEFNVAARTEWLAAVLVELIGYVCKPLPEGLGATKLRSRIHPENSQVLQLVEAAGFRLVGELVAEASYHARPTNMLLVELLNPALFSTGEAINDGIRNTGDATQRDVRPNVVHDGPANEGNDATNHADDGGGYSDGDADELLRREYMGNAGLHSTAGRGEPDPSELQETVDSGRAGRNGPVSINSASGRVRRKSTGVPKNRRGSKPRKP